MALGLGVSDNSFKNSRLAVQAFSRFRFHRIEALGLYWARDSGSKAVVSSVGGRRC